MITPGLKRQKPLRRLGRGLTTRLTRPFQGMASGIVRTPSASKRLFFLAGWVARSPRWGSCIGSLSATRYWKRVSGSAAGPRGEAPASPLAPAPLPTTWRGGGESQRAHLAEASHQAAPVASISNVDGRCASWDIVRRMSFSQPTPRPVECAAGEELGYSRQEPEPTASGVNFTT
jgi:hypothetical protein